MDERRLLAPLRFRFTEPEDVERYGPGWFVYDEHKIVRKPARDLVSLEAELGMPLIAAMNGFRQDSALGNLAGCWIAVREVDPERAGPFDDFSPMIMLIAYESVPAEEAEDAGKAEDPEADTPAAPDSNGSAPASVTPPMIVLQTLPQAGL
jgi:hypothetical protein